MKTREPVAQAIETFLAGLPPRPRVVVAFSGGLDSTVLAHAFMARRRRLASLRLVHVDHGLQPASADWSRHCAQVARRWSVAITSLRAKVRVNRGDSLEAAARDRRYELLAQDLARGEWLVTAQHQNDQAETLLLQLFRGAGVAGLAAMPPRVSFASGWLARPLLSVTRAELEAYVRRHRLGWIEDPSNQTEQFARNFLRLRVMPLLRQRWPGVDAAIARSASHLAEAAGLLNRLALQDLWDAADGDGLLVSALRRLPSERRHNALRLFIARAGFELPPTARLREIAGSLLMARPDAQPEVEWGGCIVRRRAGRLELHVKSEIPPNGAPETASKSWHWRDVREFILNEDGDRLTLEEDSAGAIDLDKLPQVLELRTRQGGERLRPGPRARQQTLKKLMQAARLTVDQRARLPLLFTRAGPKGGAKARLIVAGDRWIDASVAANVKSRRRATLVWSRRR